jgi:hypothetical protein
MNTRTPLVCSIVALVIVGASLLVQAQTNEALARCENRGNPVAYCRLVVLGR